VLGSHAILCSRLGHRMGKTCWSSYKNWVGIHKFLDVKGNINRIRSSSASTRSMYVVKNINVIFIPCTKKYFSYFIKNLSESWSAYRSIQSNYQCCVLNVVFSVKISSSCMFTTKNYFPIKTKMMNKKYVIRLEKVMVDKKKSASWPQRVVLHVNYWYFERHNQQT
jgi:hypothetical protein